jgi:hypothetical protein
MLDSQASAHPISDQAELLRCIAAPHFEDHASRRRESCAYPQTKHTTKFGVDLDPNIRQNRGLNSRPDHISDEQSRS